MNRGGVHQWISVRYHFSHSVRTDADNQWAIYIFVRSLIDWNSMNFLAMRRIIIEASNAVTFRLYNIFDDFCMSACTKQINCCH